MQIEEFAQHDARSKIDICAKARTRDKHAKTRLKIISKKGIFLNCKKTTFNFTTTQSDVNFYTSLGQCTKSC